MIDRADNDVAAGGQESGNDEHQGLMTHAALWPR